MPVQTRLSMRITLAALSLLAPAILSVVPVQADESHNLTRPNKLRVFVDKVLSQQGERNEWALTDELVGEIADAGFNVVVRRSGGDDLTSVRNIAAYAHNHGIYSMTWMRGTLHAYAPSEVKDRVVWRDGTIQKMHSPNSDRFWEWMEKTLLNYAEISAQDESLMGVFMDFENYYEGNKGTAFGLSYDQKILQEFAESTGARIPKLPPRKRYDWLKNNQLHDAFADFQIISWRQKLRRIREQVDAINPRFQFAVYPTPSESLFLKTLASEWATQEAPLIIGDWTTYGRPSVWFLSHKQALAMNKERLQGKLQDIKQIKTPYIYLSGVDPILKGADPEFCARNAVMISQMVDGYWVFYEGPVYGSEENKAYFKWFTQANKAIEKGYYTFWKEKRRTPDAAFLGSKLDRKTSKPQLGIYGAPGRMHELINEAGNIEAHQLAGGSAEYLSQFDVIVLQNFYVSLPSNNKFLRSLKSYVKSGGGLLLTYDSAWHLDSLCNDVAIPLQPKKHTSGRFVNSKSFKITALHEAIGGVDVGTKFSTESTNHVVFGVGPRGEGLIQNKFGEPVCVAGRVGRGRVVFSGSFYGKTRDMEGLEKKIFLSVLDWLAKRNGVPFEK